MLLQFKRKLTSSVIGVFAVSVFFLLFYAVQPTDAGAAPNTKDRITVLENILDQYCSPGSVVTGILPDGTLECSTLPAPILSERYVFISSSTHTGNLGGVDGADEICTQLAINAGIYRGQAYKAWISDDNHSPDAHFVKSEVPYVNRYGMIIAHDYDSLISDNPLLADMDIDEHGVSWQDKGTRYYSNVRVPDGTLYDPDMDCEDWTSDAPQTLAYGAYGDASMKVNPYWSFSEGGYREWCGTRFHLLCFEQ